MSFEGARIHVERGLSSTGDVGIDIIVNGKSDSGRLLADSQGNVLKVEIL
jgi:hypothetical protein